MQKQSKTFNKSISHLQSLLTTNNTSKIQTKPNKKIQKNAKTKNTKN